MRDVLLMSCWFFFFFNSVVIEEVFAGKKTKGQGAFDRRDGKLFCHGGHVEILLILCIYLLHRV